jgi:alpha-D-ribose 1-methylphosphonate 5-triphosphate diphosphatase
MMHGLGATIAEFPVTIEAAIRARELGMTIVAGAPNIVRGGSHSGNVSALDLASRGLCDVLVADYHAPSLLLAAQRLVQTGAMDLLAAMRLVTEHPARAMGRDDLGVLAPGKTATLALIDPDDRGWRSIAVVREGSVRATFGGARFAASCEHCSPAGRTA